MDYYRLLGLKPGASQKEIRDAYRCQVSNCHPDKFQDSEQKKLAEERIKQVNAAYETLHDVSLRDAYDQQQAQTNSSPTPKPRSVHPYPKQRTVTYKQHWHPGQGYSRSQTYQSAPAVSPLEHPYPDLSTPYEPAFSVLHYIFSAKRGDRLQVFLNQSASLLLLDDFNFACYRTDSSFQYLGGLARSSPVILTVPFSGRWHLVIEPARHVTSLQASVHLLYSTW
jgi:curved DNA-binding protein CbpA